MAHDNKDSARIRAGLLEIINVLPLVTMRAGGPPVFVGPTAIELQARGHTVRTLTTDLALSPGAPGQRAARPEEIHPAIAASGYAAYPTRSPRRLLYSPELAAAANAAAATADVVHVHSLWLHPQFAGYRAAVRRGRPLIVSPHGALDPALASRGRARKWMTNTVWQRQMLERATLIHITTDAEGDLIRDVAPHVPRFVVPLGIDLEDSEPPPQAREHFRRSHLGGYDGPVVLFLGRITFKKGIDLLIEAVAQVCMKIDCRLVVAGPDDEELTPSLQTIAERCGIADRVTFVGPVFGEQRSAAFAAADAFALSSHTENFGVAVIEAMAAGCPVVVSRAVNLATEMTAADAGIVVDLTRESVADGLRSVLASSSLRDRMSRAGRDFAMRYELGTVADRLEMMYRAAIERAADSPS